MKTLLPSVHHIPDVFARVLSGVFGSRNDRVIEALKPIVAQINDLEPQMQALSDEALQGKTPEFKKRLETGETLDQILPEAFAVVRETGRRILGMRHFDVQLMGGILLHRGSVIEMMTGEGKTLVATSPVYLNALAGKGVHVITVNDYLAKRDSDWMGKIYRFLGLTVGCIQSRMEDHEFKRQQYEADITYGTGNEFGFDYLRDNMKVQSKEQVQGQLNFCVIDEVDSILIDEARTPLIISGAADENEEKYIVADRAARHLKREQHFKIDEKETFITLQEPGVKKCEELLGIDNMYDAQNSEYPHYINNSLRAHHLMKKDKDYVVHNGEIVIIDENTGRMQPGRRWSDGLHQAIEVKEGLAIQRESQTLASITFQNLFKLYTKMSGMTGTAMTEAGEFHKIYEVDVVAVPPNKPCVRQDQPDLVYGTKLEKMNAIINEIEQRHKNGQPVLVGTASIESSEEVSQALSKSNIPHEVLNAKNHAREALIIAQAGHKGAVTVATNMAGRGTDIVLGGNVEVVVKTELGEEAAQEEIDKVIEERKPQFQKDHDDILDMGGLYVLGTERHESRRIDNQLRGRSGRQGDPGESRFYLSLDDDLMRRFAPPWAIKMMKGAGLSDGEPIEHKLVTKSISNAQKKVEEFHFESRKHLLEFDEVMSTQRNYIYGLRARVLGEDDLEALLREWVEDAIYDRVEDLQAELPNSDDPALTQSTFTDWVKQSFLEVPTYDKDLSELDLEVIVEPIVKSFNETYDKKIESLGQENCRFIERYLLLQTIDQNWKEHLYDLDHVKDSINFRSYAQLDAKVEYKKEGNQLFRERLRSMKRQVATMAIRLSIAKPEDVEVQSVYHEEQAIHQQANSAVHEEREEPQEAEVVQPIVNNQPRVGRNDPCPCGSGKKYKNCCLKKQSA